MKSPLVLIAYDSRTGNTETMARAVAEGASGVPGVRVKVKRVARTTLRDLEQADGIVLGSPTYYGLLSAPVKALLDRSVKLHGRLEGRVGAAFTSAGGTATGAETTILSILEALLVHGMVVQGRSSDKHYGVACVGAPNREAARLCRELGARTARLVRALAAARAGGEL
jgi:NAD(P)H dehydrogenase (quinone)